MKKNKKNMYVDDKKTLILSIILLLIIFIFKYDKK